MNHHLNAKNMESLDKKQQTIVVIAAHTAAGNPDALKTGLSKGLDVGLTVNQIKEILVHLYAYTGFPRSLQGINTFMTVLNERKAKGIHNETGADASPITDPRDKYARGKENLEKLTGRHETQITGANAFAPAIDQFLKEHLFADIFERDVLTFQERELVTISALSAMKGVEPMLQSHINMGMNTGLTEKQLDEVMTLIGSAIDTGQEKTGRQLLKQVTESRNNKQ
jgi:alkylhydroperoxidase/carboxymuconolactone decarboxylase family protein YurZ